ncbi:asparagine synthase [Micromonospora tarensis]|uniref:asparagine synthase (glutamine-hydrolyzing) n=1 Tax=Micromonospora tarensis TaxID=2806100 RepID=A0ABS1YAM0_9ACTN|nr:asparagine synthase [Micromonospora tarensis]MBM0274449.1 asparagine synthase [Micromonospora tarensis]
MRVAMIGQFGASADDLTRLVARATSVSDVDHVHDLPGSFAVIAADGDAVKVQGTASGWHRVYHAEINGCTVAASRADLLAALTGAEPTASALAIRLLEPVPYPLGEAPMWQNVTAVDPYDQLVVTGHGRHARSVRWWSAPEPALGLADGAQAVRAALTAAVDARMRPGQPMSTDLSGGYDSTALAFLAERRGADLVACTAHSDDPLSDELGWARLAATHLRLREHIVLPPEEFTLPYAEMGIGEDVLDEPSMMVPYRGRAMSTIRRMAGTGSTMHFTGFGGDQLFTGSPIYLQRLMRRSPRRAVANLRGYRALFSWRRGALLRELLDRRSLRSSLLGVNLDEPPSVDITIPSFGWVPTPRVPQWLTPMARDMINEALRAAATSAVPLVEEKGTHLELHGIRAATREVSVLDAMARTVGLPLAAPFFDDHVIAAAFSVRSEERVTPYRYKPLLAAAMRGIVPDDCLDRQTKAQGGVEGAEGLRQERVRLAQLWEDSRLADLGLVDAGRLRQLCSTPSAPELADGALLSTIACESWLRTRPASIRPTPWGPDEPASTPRLHPH